MTAVTITCTTQQAECITRALELYTRLGLGQFEEVTYLCKIGMIRHRHGECSDVQIEQIESLCYSIKYALGHPSNGSFGIGSPMLHESTQRAYEIKKQIDKALAEHRNPNPSPGFRGVDYDGRIVRYTSDPDITVSFPVSCVWTEDSDGIWHSHCGRSWEFSDSGTPSMHKVSFCHGCGRPVQEPPFVEDQS